MKLKRNILLGFAVLLLTTSVLSAKFWGKGDVYERTGYDDNGCRYVEYVQEHFIFFIRYETTISITTNCNNQI